jgi:N-methylhydantoinase A
VTGPAVIEEFGSTVPVLPGFSATVDPTANLLLARETTV